MIKRKVWPGTRALSPGVIGAGYSPEPGVFILEMIEASQQGNGNVGRYVGELQSRYHTILVPAVISPRLAGMLERRGFVEGERDTWGWVCPLAPTLPHLAVSHGKDAP
jgi:hypothetical protein